MKLIIISLTILIFGCSSNSETQIKLETESAQDFISIISLEASTDFTSLKFSVSNHAEISYYSTIVVVAEFRDDTKKIGSERLVVYPQSLFGPDDTYNHKSKLHPAPGTKNLILHIDRATLYPKEELKAAKKVWSSE